MGVCAEHEFCASQPDTRVRRAEPTMRCRRDTQTHQRICRSFTFSRTSAASAVTACDAEPPCSSGRLCVISSVSALNRSSGRGSAHLHQVFWQSSCGTCTASSTIFRRLLVRESKHMIRAHLGCSAAKLSFRAEAATALSNACTGRVRSLLRPRYTTRCARLELGVTSHKVGLAVELHQHRGVGGACHADEPLSSNTCRLQQRGAHEHRMTAHGENIKPHLLRRCQVSTRTELLHGSLC